MTKTTIFKSEAGKGKILSFYDSVLKNWPVKYGTITIPTRHGNTFIIESGNKNLQPLILLHGAASNATSWIGDVEKLSQYFRIYSVDIIGDPGKSDPNRPSYSGLGYAEWLYDVINGLEIKKVSIAGISQGGWTALRFATCYPAFVEKLILLSPAGIVATKFSFLLKAIFFTSFGKAGTRRLNRIVFNNQTIHPEALKFMDLIMEHFKARIEKEYLFSDQELKKLDMPVLMIGGNMDAIRSCNKINLRLRKNILKFESLIIPDMGHVLINLSDKMISFLISANDRENNSTNE
jgi:pimeloyl-ACP methyl ester carboxylesterase